MFEEEKKEELIKSGLSDFQSSAESNNLIFAGSDNCIESILLRCECDLKNSISKQDKMKEKCFQIHKNVKFGKPENYEINLNQKMQIFNKKILDLENCVIKIKTFYNDTPFWISFTNGDKPNIVILIGDNMESFIVIGDDKNNIRYVKLCEFYMLANIVTNDDEDETESGWLTSYSWMLGKVFTSEIMGYSLEPVKSLLLSDWINESNSKEILDNNEGENDE